MKVSKKYFIIFLIVSLCVLTCGCGSLGLMEKKYTEGIRDYLSAKYEEEMVIDDLYAEFSGGYGLYVRAVCHSKRNDEQFVVYCYADDTAADEKISIGGKSYAITDTYCEVYLQNKLYDELKSSENENTMIKCKVIYNEQYPNTSDLKKGLSHCLNRENFKSYIKIYIFSDDVYYAEDLQNEIHNFIMEYNAYYTCVFYAELEEFNSAEIEAAYRREYDNFSNYLKDYDLAKKVSYLEYDANYDRQSFKVLKE